MEALARTTTIAVDKTGTITAGRMVLKRCEITRSLPPELRSDQRWWQLVQAAEQDSSHWAATAILIHLSSAGPNLHRLSEAKIERKLLTTVPGRGISCSVDGVKVVIGNQVHLESHGINSADLSEHFQSLQPSESCVLVAFDNYYAGMLAFEDRIAENVRSTVESLKARGMRVCMVRLQSIDNLD